MSPARKALIAENRHAYEQRSKKNAEVTPSPVSTGEGWGEGALPDNMEDPAEDIAVTGEGATFPPSASMCHKCSTKAVVIMDGCANCLNCGYSSGGLFVKSCGAWPWSKAALSPEQGAGR